MSASVICVDSSSDSEEESPPGGKRRRLTDPKQQGTPSGGSGMPTKLVNILKASLGPAGSPGTGPARGSAILADPLRSMHIPSGITVTKHQKNNMTANGSLTISLAENNNNNTNSCNNNVMGKPMKMVAAQNVAWSVSSKAPSSNAVITSVPSNQVKITPSQQIRVTPTGKVVYANASTGAFPKQMPAKIIAPVGIGQQQQQQQQQPTQKPSLKISVTKPKTQIKPEVQQQPQKQLLGQLLQQPPKPFVGAPQQKVSISQLQPTQKVMVGQFAQQHLQAQQQKMLGGKLQQLQPQKILPGQVQQPQQPKLQAGQIQPIRKITEVQAPITPLKQKQKSQKSPIVQLQQQPKQPQPQKVSIGQAPQQQRVSLGQIPHQQQPQQPQLTQHTRVSLGPVAQQQPNPFLDPIQQQSLAHLQSQQMRASIGQLQMQQMQQKANQQSPQAAIVQQQPKQQPPKGNQGPQQQKGLAVGQLLPQKNLKVHQQNKTVIGPQSTGQPQPQPVPRTVNPSINQITHKSMTIQKLPTLQKTPAVAKVPPKQLVPPQMQQPLQASPLQKQLPLGASSLQKQLPQPPSPLQKTVNPLQNQLPQPAHVVHKPPAQPANLSKKQTPKAANPLQKQSPQPAHPAQMQITPMAIPTPPPPQKSSGSIVRPPTVAKISPVSPTNRPSYPFQPQMPGAVNPLLSPLMSAARTLPFRSTSHNAAPTPLTAAQLQGFTVASATPPQRLLATPPHCAAALNEPLLLNLPPTTSITPQLTPTTTPPPAAIPASVQQLHLAKAAAFKLNSLPGASISSVPIPKPPAKRVQPITVLKKSDEEWRRHLLEQQVQQKQKEPPEATPTIVLVESPPTTPPTEKLEVQSNGTSSANDHQNLQPTAPKDKSRKLKSPDVTEVVDLVDQPETPPRKKRKLEKPTEKSPPARAPFNPVYAAFLKLCREVDKSSDMERLVQGNLTKYYYSVNESFLQSRGFRKLLEVASHRIRNESDLVYVHIKNVVDEMKARRLPKVKERKPSRESSSKTAASASSKETTTPSRSDHKKRENHVAEKETAQEQPKEKADEPEPISPTGDLRRDERIRKLNRTLYTITKRIKMLEEADVDFNDEDSSYLQVERFKKRACQIYEKICDLTGESKSAHRHLKQPIVFKDTPYEEFNRTLSAFVNRMKEFPDYHDVLQLLEHCNKEKELGLAKFEMKRIAYDAFNKVGQLLQSRRKTDLYETVTHFTSNDKDPAASDPELLAKLKENSKKQKKISDVLEKYAREQDLNAEERQEARQKEKQLKQKIAEEAAAKLAAMAEEDDKPCTSAQAAAKAAAAAALLKESEAVILKDEKPGESNPKEDEDGDDSEEESESEDEDVDEFVDNFKVNGEVSDAESEAEADVDAEDADADEDIADAEEGDEGDVPEEGEVAAPDATDDVAKVASKDSADVIDITRSETDAKDDQSLPNGKLKIMSVTSLNASIVHEPSPTSKISAKPAIDAEIVISDEEL
ncbi:daxx-like protein [Drosophila bipectinata]|uniref:daxx-like protein n=1 Tax=Drosophila bipectinata TaxID=42026 RepID=UPI0038B28A3E